MQSKNIFKESTGREGGGLGGGQDGCERRIKIFVKIVKIKKKLFLFLNWWGGGGVGFFFFGGGGGFRLGGQGGCE